MMTRTSDIKDFKKLIIKTDKKLNKFDGILNKNSKTEEINKLEKLDKSRVKFENNLNKIENTLKKFQMI